jgi:DNA-binding NarL/FixJ family response regulator
VQTTPAENTALSAAIRDVLVVEDHPLYHHALTNLVGQANGDVTVHSAVNLEQGLHKVAQIPHMTKCLVILDLNLPERVGIQSIHRLLQVHPKLLIVAISASDDPMRVAAALGAGAQAFISKSADAEVVLDLIRRALAGELRPEWITANGSQPLKSLPRIHLTARQVEVLSQICQGHPNKVISSMLDITEQTIKAHISAIFRELGVVNRTQAVLVAKRLGIEVAQ